MTLRTMTSLSLAFLLTIGALPVVGIDSTLFLGPGGNINGQSVDEANRWIRVGRGEPISGMVNLAVDCNNSAGAFVPMGYTTTWGDRTVQPVLTHSWVGPLETDLTFPLSKTAPDDDGVYFALVAFAGRFDISQVMSATHAAIPSVWNDGNDLGWIWNVAQYEQAVAEGNVTIEVWDGSTFYESQEAASWIGIIVGDTSTVHLSEGGNVNGQPVGPGQFWIEAEPGEHIQGFVNVDVVCLNAPGAIVPMGYSATWEDPSSQPVVTHTWIGPRTATLTLDFDKTAPNQPGEYYMPISYAGRFNIDQVFSGTHAAITEVYGDGNDLGWYWDPAQFDQGHEWGFVIQETLFPDGEMYYQAQAATWVGIHVFHDCNDNGRPDEQDTAEGTVTDCNTNGVPDECEFVCDPPSSAACPACDIYCDGVVNGLDLAIINSSANFGKATCDCFEPRADVNGDGAVNGLDIAECSSSACFGR